MIRHGKVSWTMRKALRWEVIYTLKTTKELWTKCKDGETGKNHIRQDHITESARSVIQFAVFNFANINTFVLFPTILINLNSVTRVLASSIHYIILKSTMIKALEACEFTTVRVKKEPLALKRTSSYEARSIMG